MKIDIASLFLGFFAGVSLICLWFYFEIRQIVKKEKTQNPKTFYVQPHKKEKENSNPQRERNVRETISIPADKQQRKEIE